MQRILVIDDKLNVREMLADYLGEQGYDVCTAENGRVGLDKVSQQSPDLILVDLMMPVMDGFEFIEAFRQTHSTPVIVISAKRDETDAVIGLELGADDYVVKPFRMRELVARIRANLRRASGGEGSAEILTIGSLSINQTSHTVSLSNTPISLTPTEFDLLSIMMKSAGRVLTRAQILEQLIDGDATGMEKTLNVHVRNLRHKIEPDPSKPRYLQTVFGIGYRFCAAS